MHVGTNQSSLESDGSLNQINQIKCSRNRYIWEVALMSKTVFLSSHSLCFVKKKNQSDHLVFKIFLLLFFIPSAFYIEPQMIWKLTPISTGCSTVNIRNLCLLLPIWWFSGRLGQQKHEIEEFW